MNANDVHDAIEVYRKIVKANGVDLFQFNFAGNCLVEVKLEELNDHIVVQLTQSNIPTDDESKQNILNILYIYTKFKIKNKLPKFFKNLISRYIYREYSV